MSRVSPWLVELVANIPAINFSPYSPTRKKSRLPQHPDFPLDGQIPVPTFPSNLLGPSNPFGCLPESTPAGMQGARHAHYGLSLSDLHLNKLQSGLFQVGNFPPFDRAATPMRVPNSPTLQKPNTSDNVSCLLSIASSTQSNSKKPDDVKAPHLVLFGQTILTEQQISLSTSADTNSSPDGNAEKMTNFSDGYGSALHQQGLLERYSCERFQRNKNQCQETLEIGHCKVFMESEDVGRTMDLSLLGSYDELYRKLADMFGIQKSEVLSHVLYRDITGAVKHIGDETFR